MDGDVSNQRVRVRFAPSPTGYLHIGGARTALFNWLFARHEGGELRLRIENTDTSREVAEATEKLEDLVLVRSDGRPTYNFVSPLEDMLDGITHVIRGQDHVPNTPKQLRILDALGAELPEYAHVPLLNGPDGGKLSKRHGAITVEEFRAAGFIPEALVNYLALLGWSYDDRTEIMSRDELVERFSLERVGKSAATFDYEKLEHFNGVYLRALPRDEYADRLVAYVREQGYDWDEALI